MVGRGNVLPLVTIGMMIWCCCCIAQVSSVPSPISLSGQLSSDPHNVASGVMFTLANPSTRHCWVMIRGTPLEGLRTDIFDIVASNGKRVDYVGLTGTASNRCLLLDFLSLHEAESN
jgi:hypothetical protein